VGQTEMYIWGSRTARAGQFDLIDAGSGNVVMRNSENEVHEYTGVILSEARGTSEKTPEFNTWKTAFNRRR
jgi:hypothetical protein